ncbi:MAG: FAD-dependent oxidoreductase, partial [Dehalococcoidia bacterium]|nr:FAD-dependent oxidoreductase [Dehalococcoidia bacterium]
VVILATGSSATIPEVAEGKPGVMTHSEALERKTGVGNKVVVWGFFGSELAISLAEEGKEVVLLGRSGEGSLASDLSWARRWYLLRRLTDINVPRAVPEAVRLSNPEVLYNANIEDITTEGIKVVTTTDNVEVKRVIPCDTLILSRRFGERKTNDSLFDQLQEKVAEVYKIGDCSQVRGIKEAVWTANEVARKI